MTSVVDLAPRPAQQPRPGHARQAVRAAASNAVLALARIAERRPAPLQVAPIEHPQLFEGTP